MFNGLEVFKMASALARHSGVRQSVISQNIANADTPGYRAKDIQQFDSLVRNGNEIYTPRATRAGHLNGSLVGSLKPETMDVGGPSSPNGNNVSIEEQMLQSVEVKRAHDRALAVYKSSLGILRTSLGRNG